MLTKERLIHSLGKLPEKFSVDELVEHVVLLEKVQLGLDDVTNGKVNTKQEAKKKLSNRLSDQR